MLFGRRVVFAIVVLASQLLLITLGVAFGIQLFLIAKHNRVYLIEQDSVILYAEIIATIIIILFAIAVFILQCWRLTEKRKGDDRRESDRLRQDSHSVTDVNGGY